VISKRRKTLHRSLLAVNQPQLSITSLLVVDSIVITEKVTKAPAPKNTTISTATFSCMYTKHTIFINQVWQSLQLQDSHGDAEV
jgi:hypothetical protein